MSVTFNALHAFVIDAYDTHSCDVSAYVEEFSHTMQSEVSGDICKIHSAFHTPFLLPQELDIFHTHLQQAAPQSQEKTYISAETENFLKPPKNI